MSLFWALHTKSSRGNIKSAELRSSSKSHHWEQALSESSLPSGPQPRKIQVKAGTILKGIRHGLCRDPKNVTMYAYW